MAAFLTIEMVKEWIRKCREDEGINLPPPLPPEIANKVINLDIQLPPGWKQCLEMKTGEICFINKKIGARIDNKTLNAPGQSHHVEESRDEDATVVEPVNYLVAVACKKCMKYMMVAKSIEVCPKCGEILLHFTEERCSGDTKMKT